MAKCNFCGKDAFIFRMDESSGKTRLWNDNIGIFHTCDENPYDRKQKLESWKTKWDLKKKFDVPIYCPRCNIAYNPKSVCGHILSDGYVEGVDTAEFYSDNPKMAERRNLIKKSREVKAPKDPQEKLF